MESTKAKTPTKAKTDNSSKPKVVAVKDAETFKYGVDDVAKALNLKPASVRVQLRNQNVTKAGKSYGWNSRADLDEVIKKLKNDNKAPAKKVEKKSAK